MITNSSRLKFKYDGSINLLFICNFHFKIITWCGAIPGFSFIVCGRGAVGGGILPFMRVLRSDVHILRLYAVFYIFYFLRNAHAQI